MLINFNEIEEMTIPCMMGGKGMMSARCMSVIKAKQSSRRSTKADQLGFTLIQQAMM